MSTYFRSGKLGGGPFLWSDGTRFNGYMVINFAPPLNGSAAWPSLAPTGIFPEINLPLSARVPIINGDPSTAVQIIYNTDITPPNTFYQAWLFEMNGVEVAGPSSTFTVSTDPFTVTISTPTVPPLGTAIQPD